MSTAIFDDLPIIMDIEGNRFHLVKYHKPTTLIVWDDPKPKDGAHFSQLRRLNLADLSHEVLCKLDIWEDVPADIQEKIKNHVQIQKEAVHSLMEKARASKRRKYPNIPKQILCTECGGTIDVIPSVIAKKIEQKGIMLVDYIKGFKCPECNKRIGWVRRKK